MAYAKIVKAFHPSAQFSLIVVWPYHVTPLFHASFSQRFHFCHYFFSKIFLSIGSHILDAVARESHPIFKIGGHSPFTQNNNIREIFCFSFPRNFGRPTTYPQVLFLQTLHCGAGDTVTPINQESTAAMA